MRLYIVVHPTGGDGDGHSRTICRNKAAALCVRSALLRDRVSEWRDARDMCHRHTGLKATWSIPRPTRDSVADIVIVDIGRRPTHRQIASAIALVFPCVDVDSEWAS